MNAFETLPASLFALRQARDAYAAKSAARLAQFDAGIQAIQTLLEDETTVAPVASEPANIARVRPATLHELIQSALEQTPNMKVVEIARTLVAQGYGSDERGLQNSVSRVLSTKPGFTKSMDRRWSLASSSVRPQLSALDWSARQA